MMVEYGKIFQIFSLYIAHSWCVSLNVDWLQPFTHVCDSVGALYLVIQNLPRQDRYKRENMILVGVIPGPKEPKLDINSYLSPLVHELLQFYNGVVLPCTSPDGRQLRSVMIRLALTCVVCDLPATRKVCGFLSYCALHGCSKCLKEFHTASCPDYSVLY